MRRLNCWSVVLASVVAAGCAGKGEPAGEPRATAATESAREPDAPAAAPPAPPAAPPAPGVEPPPGAPTWWFDGVRSEGGRIRVAASADAGSLTAARTEALAAARARLSAAVAGPPSAEDAEMIHMVTLGTDRFRCFVRMSCTAP